MRLAASQIVLVVLLAGCAPTVGEQLTQAEQALAGSDAHAAALAFAAVVEATEPGTAEWLAAKRGVVRSIAGELPERAVRELEELTTDHPEAVTLDDWIDVIDRAPGTARFDVARRLVDERRPSAWSAERERLEQPDRALRVAAICSRASGDAAGAELASSVWSRSQIATFRAADDVAAVCAEIARSTDDAYAGYLELARHRALGPDDYGALALAFYDELDREHASWVLWTACFEHSGDARLRDLADFVRYGPSRSISRLQSICDY